MAKLVLDSSAVLAVFLDEPGNERVPVDGAVISSVNLCEVVSVLTKGGMTETDVHAQLAQIALEVIPFDRDCAVIAGLMVAQTRQAGLSLGDRACLATARAKNYAVQTADRAWNTIDVGVDIELIR